MRLNPLTNVIPQRRKLTTLNSATPRHQPTALIRPRAVRGDAFRFAAVSSATTSHNNNRIAFGVNPKRSSN